MTELLETPATDVEALAEAVILELDKARIRVPQFVIRISGWDGPMGPFITKTQALIAARALSPGTDDETLEKAIVQLVSPAMLTDPEQPLVERLGTHCEDCGHPMAAHDWPGVRVTGCIVGWSKKGGPESGCQCGRQMEAA